MKPFLRALACSLALAIGAAGCISLRAPLPQVDVDEMHAGPYAGGACLDANDYQKLKAKLAILESR